MSCMEVTGHVPGSFWLLVVLNSVDILGIGVCRLYFKIILLFFVFNFFRETLHCIVCFSLYSLYR